ncbi:hypothetical protein F5Y18DRAFT_438791 [Xylariaceae sp. FL1019]|nr:hypothetical protein F5Y18DRAFT_438791 [Xylariaceae sp. FL1019]
MKPFQLAGALVLALTGFAVAQDQPSVCAIGCINDVFSAGVPGTCAGNDQACVCNSNTDLMNGIRDCFTSACVGEVADVQIPLADQYATSTCGVIVAAQAAQTSSASPVAETTPPAPVTTSSTPVVSTTSTSIDTSTPTPAATTSSSPVATPSSTSTPQVINSSTQDTVATGAPTSVSSETTSAASSASSSTTDSAAPAETNSTTSKKSSGLSTPVKAGIGAGVGAAALAALTVALCLCLRRRKKPAPAPLRTMKISEPMAGRRQYADNVRTAEAGIARPGILKPTAPAPIQTSRRPGVSVQPAATSPTSIDTIAKSRTQSSMQGPVEIVEVVIIDVVADVVVVALGWLYVISGGKRTAHVHAVALMIAMSEF